MKKKPLNPGTKLYLCNESRPLADIEKSAIQRSVQVKLEEIFELLRIDTANDHNMKDTARRVSKMWVYETMAGRFNDPPEVTAFPNVKNYDQLYIVGPIPVRSLCAHHFQNIVGKAWIGVFPGKEVIGLSKFNRLVDWIASRPQIQEEMTEQIADEIMKVTKAKGLAVIVKAEHHCMLARGVKAHESDMMTSVLRGVFKQDATLRSEFLALLQGQKGFKSD